MLDMRGTKEDDQFGDQICTTDRENIMKKGDNQSDD